MVFCIISIILLNIRSAECEELANRTFANNISSRDTGHVTHIRHHRFHYDEQTFGGQQVFLYHKCKCLWIPFETRWRNSYAAVIVEVIKVHFDNRATLNGRIPQFQKAMYTMSTIDRYKDPKNQLRKTFKVQMFTHSTSCGFEFWLTAKYLLFFKDPSLLSKSGNWIPGIFQFSMCDYPIELKYVGSTERRVMNWDRPIGRPPRSDDPLS